jgi:hypothetical protein
MPDGSWLALSEGSHVVAHLPRRGGEFVTICWDEVTAAISARAQRDAEE